VASGDKRVESLSSPAVDNADPPDAGERAIFKMAFEERAFEDALGAYQRGQLIRALALLKAENYSVAMPTQPASGHAWAKAMVAELDRVIEAAGLAPPYKLLVAREMFAALGILQGIFEATVDNDGRDQNDMLAEWLLAAIRLGAAEAMLAQTQGGLIDEYMFLKWDKSRTQESRRRGAAKVNERKATAKQNALSAAIGIAERNATLSNEDIAIKLHSSVAADTTVKTLTQWVREWRRRELLPAQKKG
jgi:hypothetical protein